MSERLRRIAEAATPGPWVHEHDDMGDGDYHYVVAANGDSLTDEEGLRPANAHHIAAFDPPMARALLDVVDAARGAIRELFRSAEAGSVERLEDALAALDALEAERAR